MNGAAGLTRRAACGSGLAALAVAACTARSAAGAAAGGPAAALRAIPLAPEQRLGVWMLDPATGRGFGLSPDTRFAMCSTFKTSLAAMVLAQIDRGALDPYAPIIYPAAGLPEYSPVTSARAGQGMTALELAEAVQVMSDNGAANILLGRLGGPAALTAFWRTIGDPVSRLADVEPALNHVPQGSARNTTTPRAMAATLAAILTGSVLAPTARDRLLGWMAATATGPGRLRAGIPGDWWSGDKTGTGVAPGFPAHYNDIAMIRAPSGRTLVVAAFLQDTRSDHMRSDEADPILAAVGRIAAASIGGPA